MLERRCPECGGRVSEANLSVALHTGQYPFIEIDVKYCVECDWATIEDWRRKPGKIALTIYHGPFQGR